MQRNFWQQWAIARGLGSLLLLLCVVGALQAQPLRVDSILVEGVKKTKPQVILRQMAYEVGDTVLEDDLEELNKKSRSNIYNLGLFTTVELVNEIGEGVVIVRVRVQERWYVWPTPYVSLQERTFNEWWQDKDLDRLVYGMGVEWGNLSGWNDRGYVYAQNGYSQEVSAQYSRPFIFPKAKIDMAANFQFISNKEIGYSTDQGYLQLARLRERRMRQSYTGLLLFSKRLDPRRLIHLSMGYQSVHLNDSITYFNPKYLPDGRTQVDYPSLALSYVNDQRDIRSFPLSGFKYSASIRALGLPGVSASTFGKVALSFSHHIPLSKRWNFAYGSQQFMLIGKEIPYFDKYFIGFGSFLRGYEPFVIDGSFINLTKAEWKFGVVPYRFAHLKWLPFQKFRDFPLGVYISAYADAGYVGDWTFNDQDGFLKRKPLLGYGAGINVITIYDFLLRVEYSRNLLGMGGIYISSLVSIQ